MKAWALRWADVLGGRTALYESAALPTNLVLKTLESATLAEAGDLPRPLH